MLVLVLEGVARLVGAVGNGGQLVYGETENGDGKHKGKGHKTGNDAMEGA